MKKTPGSSGFVKKTDDCAKIQYLITGADGFIGREIAAQLGQRGCRVRGLVHRHKPHIPIPAGVELVLGDILDPSSLDALMGGIDAESAVLIHTAGVISVRRHNARCRRVNVDGTDNILAACKRHGIRRLVHFASVDALVPNPDGSPVSEPTRFCPDVLPTAYARSKAASAQRVLDAASDDLTCVLLLPSAVTGPGDYRKGFITQMLSLYLSGLPRLSVNGGYEFVDVRDVASAAIAASNAAVPGSCYILSNTYADVTTVFNTLAAYTGRKPIRRALPLWVLYPLAPFVSAACRVIGKEPPLTAAAVHLMRIHPAYCHDKAARELGFSPRPLTQTLIDTAAFILAQRKR